MITDRNKKLKRTTDKSWNNCKKKIYNIIARRYPPKSPTKSISEVVLFVRADDGRDVLNSIKQNDNKLDSAFASDLYVYTENMWAGENLEFERNTEFSNLFNYTKEEKSSIPAMDFVVLHIHINKDYVGVLELDAANRGFFFEGICSDKLQVKISKRLPYNLMPKYVVWQK
jgi:hypothetical protein